MFSNDLLLDDDEETPIHLQPYDPSKYEVPSQNVKYATGYAFLDVDPFPRASVMKLCYAILDRLNSPRIPEDCMYRMYTEEMIKYFMNLTDQIEDIPKLESELGFDSIEIFIQNLKDELELVDDMESIFIRVFQDSSHGLNNKNKLQILFGHLGINKNLGISCMKGRKEKKPNSLNRSDHISPNIFHSS